MTSLEDQGIYDSIQFLRSQITELEARLQVPDGKGYARPRPVILRSVSRRMLLSAQRVDELVWAAYQQEPQRKCPTLVENCPRRAMS
jgi:hypothetical protein